MDGVLGVAVLVFVLAALAGVAGYALGRAHEIAEAERLQRMEQEATRKARLRRAKAEESTWQLMEDSRKRALRRTPPG